MEKNKGSHQASNPLLREAIFHELFSSNGKQKEEVKVGKLNDHECFEEGITEVKEHGVASNRNETDGGCSKAILPLEEISKNTRDLSLEEYRHKLDLASLAQNVPLPPTNIGMAQNVIHGNIFMEYPLQQMKQLEQESQDKIIKEIGLKLKNDYRSRELPALPWMRDVIFPLDKYFVDLEIYEKDSVGRLSRNSIELEQIFDSGVEVPYRILIEGNPGYGKSMLCIKLAFDWARGESYLAQFRLVYLIQLRYLTCDLESVLLQESALKGKDEATIRNAIFSRTDDILLLLDGCDELPRESQAQIRALFTQSLYPTMTVVMTSRLNFHFSMKMGSNCQNRFIIRGLNNEQQRKFLKHFMLSSGKYQIILTTIEASETKELFQCPLLFILLCFLLTETEMEPITQTSMLYANMFNYMIRNSLYREDDTVVVDLFNEDSLQRKPKDVVNHLVAFGKLVQTSLASDKMFFSQLDIQRACGDLTVVNFGFLNRSVKTNFLRVTEFFEPVHKTFLEFLYAYYLEHLSYVDFPMFIKTVRTSFNEFNCNSNIIDFLVGLLKNRADIVFNNLPSHQLVSWKNSFTNLLNETATTPSLLTSLMKHVPRILEFSCIIQPPHFLINRLDFVNNMKILQFYKSLREQKLSSEYLLLLRFYVDVDLFHEENKRNEASTPKKVNPLEPTIKDLPLCSQYEASTLDSYERDLGLIRLHDYHCDIVEVKDFSVFLDKSKLASYYISVAFTIQKLQPKTVKLFGGTWLELNGLEIMMNTLAANDFTLIKFILDSHHISSEEEACFMANALYKMKVTELTITDKIHYDIDLEFFTPFLMILLTQPITYLRSLHLELDNTFIYVSQETFQSIISFVSNSPILEVFFFIISNHHYQEPGLVLPICQLGKHGNKHFKEIRLARVVLENFCQEPDHTDITLNVSSLEMISDTDFRPDQTAKAIVSCRNLNEIGCDFELAKALSTEVPSNWQSFQHITAFRIIVSTNLTSDCLNFVKKCKHLKTFSFEFLNQVTPFHPLPQMDQSDWASLIIDLPFLEIIEIRVYFVAPNLAEFLETFSLSLENLDTNRTKNGLDQLVGERRIDLSEIKISFLIYEHFKSRKEIDARVYFSHFIKLLKEKIVRKLSVFVEDEFLWACDKLFQQFEEIFSSEDKFSVETKREGVQSFRAVVEYNA